MSANSQLARQLADAKFAEALSTIRASDTTHARATDLLKVVASFLAGLEIGDVDYVLACHDSTEDALSACYAMSDADHADAVRERMAA